MSLDPDRGASPTPQWLFASRRRRFLVGRRGLTASVLSSMLVLGALVAVLYLTPGGAGFRDTFFNRHAMWASFIGDNNFGLPSVGVGIFTNIWIFLVSEVLVLIFGLLIAWMRVSRSPVLLPFRLLATIYSDIFRGVPILLIVLMIGYGLPGLRLGFLSNLSPAEAGVLALTITYSAYVSEVFRAGINSVPHGQLLAARSLGLTHATIMRRVTLPQAVRTVIPPLLNDFISLQKDTALVSLLGAVEATRAAQIYSSTTFNFSSYIVAALLFLALTIPMTRFTDHLITRDRNRRLAST